VGREDVPTFALRAADIALVRRHTRQRRPERRERPRRRQRVQRLLRERLSFGAALHVYDRRLPGHRDSFRNHSDFQGRVDRRHEPRRDLDAFTTNRTEARQREGDRVHARTQLWDRVLAGAVADRRSGLFNERWTRGFDRDARHDGAAAVLHDAGNRAELGKAHRREDDNG
jgi:hypothetical protein